MSRFGKIFLFGLGIAIVFTTASSLLITKINNKSESIQAKRIHLPTMEGQDLTALLETHQSPKIVKCNFTGAYIVEQDIAFSRNGASCDDFETRTLTYNNVIAPCSGHLDPNRELFLHCISDNNPVRQCNGVVSVNVDGTDACEYWVTIKKID